MRSGFTFTLMVTIVFASGYFLYTAMAICPIPVTYRMGEIDPRFELSEEEARLAVASAESVWEDATGQNLFTYDPTSSFTVNFVYDERQALADAEGMYREKLDQAEVVTETITSKYSELVATYDELQVTYEARVEAYEASLAEYNATVASYNDAGGAPQREYDALQAKKRELAKEQIAIEALRQKLNRLVEEINAVGERGNQVVDRYNTGVETYNDTFGKPREFTQGTYNSEGRIDIYTFTDVAELQLVLAHELGHALGIDHVEGTASVMYYLIGGQPASLELSDADLAAFTTVCGQGGWWDTIEQKLRHFIQGT